MPYLTLVPISSYAPENLPNIYTSGNPMTHKYWFFGKISQNLQVHEMHTESET